MDQGHYWGLLPILMMSHANSAASSGPSSRHLGETRTVDLGKGVTLDVVWIPPGEFMMGSPDNEQGSRFDEHPMHKVRIMQGFWMGKYQVTQRQWKALMGSNPSRFTGDDNPVEQVSWHACQEFLKRVRQKARGDFRLPTEAQWEYACRAGSTAAYCFGDDRSFLGDYAWYYDNSGDTTHPVGQKKPNAWGLHDMHGNVWEWCEDVYDSEFYYKARAQRDDPRNIGGCKDSSRVLRGGCVVPINPWLCRSAVRSMHSPSYTLHDFGFRVACLRFREETEPLEKKRQGTTLYTRSASGGLDVQRLP